MFSKKRQMQQQPFYQGFPQGGFDPNVMGPPGAQGMPGPQSFGPGQSFGFPGGGGYDFVRMQTEVRENRRLINEMLRRIIRLENYLGIRSEFETEEKKPY